MVCTWCLYGVLFVSRSCLGSLSLWSLAGCCWSLVGLLLVSCWSLVGLLLVSCWSLVGLLLLSCCFLAAFLLVFPYWFDGVSVVSWWCLWSWCLGDVLVMSW